MRPGTALDRRMADLSAHQVPFVRATVVRARRPASARPGDTALVLEDGRIEGFVGGVCAEATVRHQALLLLRSGEPLLLRISPDAPPAPQPAGAGPAGGPDGDPAGGPDADEGALVVANPCLSGGELEIFLEPLRPLPVVLVLGDSPVARALLALGPGLDYDLRGSALDDISAERVAEAAAVVVASHGRDEEPALTLAVRAGVPYVGLVASRRRGAAVLASLDLTAEQRSTIHVPAGLWIGARTPGEIAVSILAELVAARHAPPTPGSGPGQVPLPEPQAAIDPVCGMTVAVARDTPHSDAGDARQWFCCAGCRERFETDPADYPETP